ncbi:hypothetical protein [Halalkalicoccus sp. NIPERK01]|uniref:hypothetical protein n=1 Tax=Halalkalicoccus sp. NIPERK01 TaxID=3053469 RepID=UPI00256ED1CA|nr:hypothetical protein [Halalkalicoccus sp. NIPERK01]MDL5363843.1 hypothetical protein [Halalkalicoccus sp. NIPERK01]
MGRELNELPINSEEASDIDLTYTPDMNTYSEKAVLLKVTVGIFLKMICRLIGDN